MSIFKTKGIILKINKVSENEFLYTIFTKDYGKLLCNKKHSKKEKTLDLGYEINFEIVTKENVEIHKIKSIKIAGEFSRENKKFIEINNYLTILGNVNKNVNKGLAIYELYELLEIINNNNLDEIKLLLANIKVKSILGELDENHKNEYISKILKFINSNKIDRIIKLTGINEELKKELYKI